MDSVTVCIPVFERTEQLRACFESIPDGYTILIADDGHDPERTPLYRARDATVVYLPYDEGVGAKRAALAREVKTEYAFFLDPDNRFPERFDRLLAYLGRHKRFGAVTGIYDETTPRNTAAWFIDMPGVLVRQRVFGMGPPDFIGQAMLCRSEMFNTYTWDSHFRYSREHLDFFYGHAQTGEWDFGVLNEVAIPHVHDNSEHRERRNDKGRKRPDRERFREKWGKRVLAI